MQFLYPKVLWGLLALTIPIIIHLFNFRRYTTVYFSNVAFLQNIVKVSKSKSKLKNLLILLLRLLAIFFAVLAFAQPFLPKDNNMPISDQPFVAVYIDNSFSMDAEGKYGILLETAKVKAKELTGILPRNTKYLLITNEFSVLHQRFVGSEHFIEWVSQIKSTHIVRGLNEIFDKASVLLPKTIDGQKHQLYVFSDFQKTLFENFEAEASKAFNVFAIPVKSNVTSNLALDSVWFEIPGHYRGKEERIVVEISNLSDENYNEIPLMLYLNDTLKSSVVFNSLANQKIKVEIPFTIWNSGWVRAKVSINDYPITFDNDLYFSFQIVDKKKVLAIHEKDSEQFFKSLFADDENIDFVSADRLNISYDQFDTYDELILDQLDELSTGLISSVIAYCKKGGTVVFIPSKSGSIENYNNFLQNIASIKFDTIIQQDGVFSELDFNHQFFKTSIRLNDEKIRFPKYKEFYNVSFNQKTNHSTLFKTESGYPLFINASVEKGQCFISALSLNSKITDFGTHPLFVPLFYNVALYSSVPSSLYYWIGPKLFTPIRLVNFSSDAPNLLNEKENLEIKPKFNFSNGVVNLLPSVDKINAGHYKISVGADFAGYASYNYDRRESDIDYYSEEEIIQKLLENGQENISLINFEHNNLETQLFQESKVKPLGYMFVFLVFLTLLAEMAMLRKS